MAGSKRLETSRHSVAIGGAAAAVAAEPSPIVAVTSGALSPSPGTTPSPATAAVGSNPTPGMAPIPMFVPMPMAGVPPSDTPTDIAEQRHKETMH